MLKLLKKLLWIGFISEIAKKVTHLSVKVREDDGFYAEIGEFNAEICYSNEEFNEDDILLCNKMNEMSKKDLSFVAIPLMFGLHEMGHVCTNDETLDEMTNYYDEIEKIEAEVDAERLNYSDSLIIYRNLPVEKIADEWAVQFAENNEKMLRKWSKRFNRVYGNKWRNK